VKKAAFAAFGVAGVAGLTLAAAVGWELILVGAVSFAAGWFYTGGPRPYGYAGFGELFVFLFFGVVATVGSAYVQTESVEGIAVACALPVGALATALLVINNLRDIPTDRESGKLTLAVRIGDRSTRFLYAALIVGAFAATAVIALADDRAIAAVALLAAVPAVPPVRRVLSGATGQALIPVLGATGQVQLAFGVLFTAGLYASV
jgi:1,4-dihydroxy-2-naphthoate octaprenyltransferase